MRDRTHSREVGKQVAVLDTLGYVEYGDQLVSRTVEHTQCEQLGCINRAWKSSMSLFLIWFSVEAELTTVIC